MAGRGAVLAAAALAAFAGCAAAAAAEERRPLPELPPAALSGDDECANLASGAGSGACSINALQLKGRKATEGTNQGVGEILEIVSDELPRTGTPPPPLCDADIVAETCSRVNRLTTEYWGTAADTDESVIHAAEIAEQLMVDRASVVEYLTSHIGAQNMETDPSALAGGSFAVKCTELCSKTIQAIPSSDLPPTSDVGCYLPSGATSPKCDIDVSGDFFKHVVFNDHDQVEAASKFAESPTQTRSEDKADGAETNAMRNLLRDRDHLNSTQELQVLDALDYLPRSNKQLQISIANLFRVYPLLDIRVVPAEDAEADGSTESMLEKDTAHLGAKWQDDVQKVGVQAQVFAATALRSMNTAKADQQMKVWFGTDSSSSQKEVRRVLNGIHSLMSNVDYVYPGQQCHDKTYAYVIPNPPYNKNNRGQYIFYLCKTYMSATFGEKIETLTHEASHHQTMLTEDMCLSGTGPNCVRAYGRVNCQQLARQAPKKAVHNADNVAYFVNDVQPIPIRPDCPTYPSCSNSDFCGCPAGRARQVFQAQDGGSCFTCMKAPPRGSTRDTGGMCHFLPCRTSRGPTTCYESRCVCNFGYHAYYGKCVAN